MRLLAITVTLGLVGCTGDDAPPSSWQALGDGVDEAGPAYQQPLLPALAIDPTVDRPVVAVDEAVSGDLALVNVRAWSGTAWDALPATPDQTPAGSSSLAIGSDGTVWLAWLENDANPSWKLYVARRTGGGGWQRLGANLEVTGTVQAEHPSLALDSAGTPWLAWCELDPVDGVRYNVHVKHWDGSAWNLVGDDTLDQGSGIEDLAPSIALDGDDAPVLAWESDDGVIVKRWDGTSWVTLQARTGTAPSIASHGTELEVAYVDGSPGAQDVFVESWDGAAWADRGGALDDVAGTDVATSIATGADGQPIIAWVLRANGGTGVFVSRWTGAAWEPLDGLGNQGNAYAPALAVDASGAPIVVWDGGAHVQARRWIGD